MSTSTQERKPVDLNQPNEWGVPLHACNGYRCDEHYWAWLTWKRQTMPGPYYDFLRALARGRDAG